MGTMLHTQPPTASQPTSQVHLGTSAVDTPISEAACAVSGKALGTIYLGSSPRSTTHELHDLGDDV